MISLGQDSALTRHGMTIQTTSCFLELIVFSSSGQAGMPPTHAQFCPSRQTTQIVRWSRHGGLDNLGGLASDTVAGWEDWRSMLNYCLTLPLISSPRHHCSWHHNQTVWWRLVMCEYSKFRIESNSYSSIRFETSTNIRNFRILTITNFLLI